MDMEILAEILRRRKSKKSDELSKFLETMDDQTPEDVKEVKEITFGDKSVKEYKRSGDSPTGSTDEMPPSHEELEDENKEDDEKEKESFRQALKKEVKPFSSKKKESGIDGSIQDSDSAMFSEKDFKDASARKERGQKLGLFERGQLMLGKRMKK